LSFTEVSISEEPSAVVPHARICAGGGSRVTGCPTVTTYFSLIINFLLLNYKDDIIFLESAIKSILEKYYEVFRIKK